MILPPTKVASYTGKVRRHGGDSFKSWSFAYERNKSNIFARHPALGYESSTQWHGTASDSRPCSDMLDMCQKHRLRQSFWNRKGSIRFIRLSNETLAISNTPWYISWIFHIYCIYIYICMSSHVIHLQDPWKVHKRWTFQQLTPSLIFIYHISHRKTTPSSTHHLSWGRCKLCSNCPHPQGGALIFSRIFRGTKPEGFFVVKDVIFMMNSFWMLDSWGTCIHMCCICVSFQNWKEATKHLESVPFCRFSFQNWSNKWYYKYDITSTWPCLFIPFEWMASFRTLSSCPYRLA